MAGIVLSASCSSRLLLRDREAGSNGASLAQYNGFRAVHTIHLLSSRTTELSCSGTCDHGIIRTSVNIIEYQFLVVHFSFILLAN